MKLLSYRNRFILVGALALIAFAMFRILPADASVTGTDVLIPPTYTTFLPPSVGGSYIDPVFGTAIKRLSDAMHTTDVARGGMVTTIANEYSSMSPFNKDNTRLLIQHFSYFALYEGAGNFIKDLSSYRINASSEPRWSRTDPNELYFISGNQLRKFNAGTNAVTTVHTFSEYSTITGRGESDTGFNGNNFVLAGDGRYIFFYDSSTDSKGPVYDAGGSGLFDQLYLTPDDNVIVGWYAEGSTRKTGTELFDKNMTFKRQLTHALGHMDVTRDTTGEEVLVWVNGADAQLQVPCVAGVTKIRLSDAKQTCVWKGDWNWHIAIHITAPDDNGWFFMETYAPSDPIPPTGWYVYTDELLQVKLDGSEVRRLAHHRSRPFNSYLYQPKASVSRDGSKLVYASNFGLQSILGYPSIYSDAYMIDLGSTASSSGTTTTTTGTTSGSTTTGTTGTTTTTASGTTSGTTTSGSTTTGTTTGTTTASTSRIEETNSAVTYLGTWSSNTSTVHSGGSAKLSMDTTASATLTFNGTGVSFVAYCDRWAGIARVSIDGTVKGTVDTYASPGTAQKTVYTIDGLNSGAHTIKIQPTGAKNPSSGGTWVWVDAFDVTSSSTTSTGATSTTTSTAGGTTTGTSTGTTATTTTPPPIITTSAPPPPTGNPYHVEQNSRAVRFSGYWYENKNGANSGGSAKLSMSTGARATFTFVGKSVSWTAYRDGYSGIARVYIDGSIRTEVDTYAAPAQPKTIAFTVSNLTWGAHTIAIEVAGQRNPSSRGSWVWVDAFDYIGDATSPDSRATSTAFAAPGGTSAISNSDGLMRVGSAEVNGKFGGVAPSGLAIFGYRQSGVLISEAAISATAPLMKGRIYAEVSGAVNTGLAIANPNDLEATISFFFSDSSGKDYGQGSFNVPPHGQISRFLDQAPFNGTRPTDGTFTFSSSVPVSAIALRGVSNERSEFLVTTLPVTDPNEWLPATTFFPQIADGAGWTTAFVLVNPSDQTITGTIDLFEQGAQGAAGPFTLTVDGAARSSLSYSIPPRSSRRYTTAGSGTTMRVGSAQMTPAAGSPVPAGVAVFSFKSGGVTISETGIGSIGSGPAFRMYVESEQKDGIRSGIAVMNSSDTEQRVNFELIGLDGRTSNLRGSLVIPASGQRAAFLNEITGFSSLPSPFKGVLRISSENQTDIAVAGLRGRVNERGDFLAITTDATNEAGPAFQKAVLPHIVDGDGYTTQFIFYSGAPAEPASGDMHLYTQTGASLSLSLTN